MVNKVVKAPRGSPFLSSLGNLTPAWHHYLTNIEGLAVNLTSTFDGQVLIELEARLSAMEEVITAAEEQFPKRNWKFFYSDQVRIFKNSAGGMDCFINHGLGTKLVMARYQDRWSGQFYTTLRQSRTNNGDVTEMEVLGEDNYTGTGFGEGWALGFYEDLQ